MLSTLSMSIRSDVSRSVNRFQEDNAVKFDREMKRAIEKPRRQYQNSEDKLRRKVNEFLRKKW